MSQVAVRIDKHVLHLHLARPEKYNALSLEMYAEPGEGLQRLNEGRNMLSRQIFAALEPIMASEDAAEGVQSFLERRPAVFKGR